MSEPHYINELAERGEYSGVGPHDIATNIPAPAIIRAGVQVAAIVTDSTTTDIYYTVRFGVIKHSDTDLAIVNKVEGYMASGWGPGVVVISVAIVDNEVIASFTIPDGYTVNVTYRVDGLTT
jgi:hypothetical protein